MATIVPRTGRSGKRTWQAQVRKKGYPRQTKTKVMRLNGHA
jgi:hypothetical protein